MEDKINTDKSTQHRAEATPSDTAGNAGSMSLLEHLEELRFVLLKSVSALTFFSILVGVLVFTGNFMDVLYWPLDRAQTMLGLEINRDILRTRSPMSVFSVIIQVIFLGGFGLALPFMVYFASTFIAPGLTAQEKRVITPVCLAILFLFLLGAAFSFGILLPLSLTVSLQFNEILGFQPIWEPASYIGLVVWLTLGLGFIFQFPLILILLQYLAIVPTPMLKTYRRHAVVAILLFAAVITPGGDPITLGLMAAPLFLLYELAIFAGAKIVAKKNTENSG